MRRALPLLALVALAVLVLLVRGLDPAHLDPAVAWAGPSRAHPLGCAEAGADVLSVVAASLVRGIALAACVALTGFGIGVPLGALVVYRRGVAERAVLRVCDLLQAFPSFLLALVILAAVRSPSRVHLYFVFALTAWAPFARLAIVEGRVLREAAFVEAARALGRSAGQIVRLHIVPNLLPTTLVQLGSTAAAIVVSEAALSFVGFGPKDGVSLGALIDQGVVSMQRAPHVLASGALAVFVSSRVLLYAASRPGAADA